MKKTAIRGSGGTGKPSHRSSKAGLTGYLGNILQSGCDPKVEPTAFSRADRLRPECLVRLPGSITRNSRRHFVSGKGIWNVSSTQNPVVPNRVMGKVDKALNLKVRQKN